jgi:hypothetical protein
LLADIVSLSTTTELVNNAYEYVYRCKLDVFPFIYLTCVSSCNDNKSILFNFVLGKGKGYGDIEYAMMRQLGACDDKTLVVTTVHESQLLDDLPASVMTEHDLYVKYNFAI